MAQLKDLLVSGAARFLNGLNVNGDLTIAGNLLPAKTETYDVGSDSLRWNNGYFKRLGVNVNISSSAYNAYQMAVGGNIYIVGYGSFDDYVQIGGNRPSSAYKFYVNGGDSAYTKTLWGLKTSGTIAVFGGSVSNISSNAYAPTTGIQLCAGNGGATNSTAIGFHNPGISSASFGYYNIDVNNGQFRFISDDSSWDVAIGGTKKLHSSSWGSSNLVVGADGNDKIVVGYLASSTNGPVIGGHNSELSAWSPINLSGTTIYFRCEQTVSGKFDTNSTFSLYPKGSYYNEGIRIHAAPDGASEIMLCGADNIGDTGTSAESWAFYSANGNLYLNNASSEENGNFYMSGVSNYWKFYPKVGINGKDANYNLYVNGPTLIDGANVGTPLILKGGTSNWREGIRILGAGSAAGWATITLGGNQNSGTDENVWSIHAYNQRFFITHNGSDTESSTGFLHSTSAGIWKIGPKLRVATNTSSYALNAASFICDDWVRTKGATGWYNETYNGGWYMTDSTYIRNYSGKTVRMDNVCLGADNNSYRLYVNGTSYFNGNATVNGDIYLTNSSKQIRWTCGDNDYVRLYASHTASNSGYFEIATADDGTEPIFVRQYTGVFSNIVRTMTLLDNNGNTSFPSGMRFYRTRIPGGANKAVGWYRIAKLSSVEGYFNCTLYLSAYWNSGPPSIAKFDIACRHNDARIKQISGISGSVITQLRLIGGSETYYLEAYQAFPYSSSMAMADQYFYIIGSVNAELYQPTTADGSGTAAATCVIKTLDDIYVKTGSGNRLAFYDSYNSIAATSHFADSTRIAINYTSAPGYNFYVNGSSYFNGNVNIVTNSQPQLNITGVAGNWAYIRLNNGSNLWDIATLSTSSGGGLQFRAGGGDGNRTIINHNGRWDIYSTQGQNNSICLWSNNGESSISYRDKDGTYTSWTVGRGPGGIGSTFGWWNGSRNVMTLSNDGYLTLRPGVNSEMVIAGRWTPGSAVTGNQDGNDRPGLRIFGDYPQLVLMSGRVGNANHGATISLGGFDSATTTSGAFKMFTIGTPGYNVTFMDVGYGTSTNPNLNGMNGYGDGSYHIMRFNSNGTVQTYNRFDACNRSNSASYMESAIQIRERSFGGAQDDTWATAPRLSWHWADRVQCQIALGADNYLYWTKNNFSNYYPLVVGDGRSYNLQASSAVNADTVDGIHANGFLRYSLVSSLDANGSLIGNCFYVSAASIANAAHSNHAALLNVNGLGTPFQLQIPDSSVLYIYKRWYSGGAWSGWSKISAGYADNAGTASTARYLSNASHSISISQSNWINNPWGVSNLTLVWGQRGVNSSLSGDSADLTLCYGTHSKSGGAGWYMSIDGGIYCLHGIYGAVWNDYAEFRESADEQPGRVVMEDHLGICQRSSSRLQPFAGVISDTFGFSEGKTNKAKTPLAVAGRVLVYPYQDRNNYKPGDCVCAAPNGTVDIMTREEVREYPDRIVGTVSEIPEYETWGTGNVKVNGRIWIKVK